MKIADFITNPTGVGSAQVYGRGAIRASLEARYKTLVGGKTKFEVFAYSPDKNNARRVYHVRVPSETIPGFMYDIVLDVIGGYGSKTAFLNSDVLVFSNSPSWLFTYAYVANKVGLSIPWLNAKIGRTAIETAPSVTNPPESLGFEKTTSMAVMHVINGEFFRNSVLSPKPLTQRSIIARIPDVERILSDREKAETRLRKQREREEAAKKLVKKVAGTSTSAKATSKPGVRKAAKAMKAATSRKSRKV
jgi:hypothetical protein